jgi:tRNA(Ile)-lysidine synthase
MAASRKPLPNKSVVDVVADFLGRLVPPHARLTLALSGGLDSVVLFHALLTLRTRHPFDLRAVHIHHGLSTNAEEWTRFCEQLCAVHSVALTVHRVTIARDDPAGLEAAARRERRHIFAAVDADFLLTAHHQNDQAETLLLQLLRGAGPKGLAAMAEMQSHPGWQAAHLRPLLNVSRAELWRYAQTHNLAWVEDESNLDSRYRRNALRQQILPLLVAHFPGASATLARGAALQAETAELLDDLARLDAQTAIDGDRLDCAVLAALSVPRSRNLLRHFIGQRGWTMPSARRLNEALHQLLDARQDARVSVNLGEGELHRFRGGAYLIPARAPVVQTPVVWQGESVLELGAVGVRVTFTPTVGSGLKRVLFDAGRVELRLREGSERIRIAPGGPHRKLKNLLQESAVLPWERDRLPLLLFNGELIWAAGIGFDVDYLAEAGEPGLVPVCI